MNIIWTIVCLVAFSIIDVALAENTNSTSGESDSAQVTPQVGQRNRNKDESSERSTSRRRRRAKTAKEQSVAEQEEAPKSGPAELEQRVVNLEPLNVRRMRKSLFTTLPGLEETEEFYDKSGRPYQLSRLDLYLMAAQDKRNKEAEEHSESLKGLFRQLEPAKKVELIESDVKRGQTRNAGWIVKNGFEDGELTAYLYRSPGHGRKTPFQKQPEQMKEFFVAQGIAEPASGGGSSSSEGRTRERSVSGGAESDVKRDLEPRPSESQLEKAEARPASPSVPAPAPAAPAATQGKSLEDTLAKLAPLKFLPSAKLGIVQASLQNRSGEYFDKSGKRYVLTDLDLQIMAARDERTHKGIQHQQALDRLLKGLTEEEKLGLIKSAVRSGDKNGLKNNANADWLVEQAFPEKGHTGMERSGREMLAIYLSEKNDSKLSRQDMLPDEDVDSGAAVRDYLASVVHYPKRDSNQVAPVPVEGTEARRASFKPLQAKKTTEEQPQNVEKGGQNTDLMKRVQAFTEAPKLLAGQWDPEKELAQLVEGEPEEITSESGKKATYTKLDLYILAARKYEDPSKKHPPFPVTDFLRSLFKKLPAHKRFEEILRMVGRDHTENADFILGVAYPRKIGEFPPKSFKDFVNTIEEDGTNPFQKLILEKPAGSIELQPKVIRFLLERGADPDITVRPEKPKGLMGRFFKKESKSSVDLLMERFKETAHGAKHGTKHEAVRDTACLVLNHSASKRNKHLEQVDSITHEAALHFAVENYIEFATEPEAQERDRELKEWHETIEKIAKNSNPNVKNSDGQTPLDLVAIELNKANPANKKVWDTLVKLSITLQGEGASTKKAKLPEQLRGKGKKGAT